MDSNIEVTENEIFNDKEEITNEDLVNKLIPPETQALIIDYFQTLFAKDTNFTKGLSYSDYDIILSSVNAENNEVFHSLSICNCNFDPNTPPSKKVIVYEDLAKIMTAFMNWKKTEKNFREVYMHAYPLVRKNLKFKISDLPFKEVVNDKLVDYKMEQNKDPDKDIVYFCMFKLVKPAEEEKKEEEKKEETVWPKRHKFGKIEQLLEQFEDTKTRMEKEKGGWSLQEFWKFYKYAYFIFCVDKEEDILKNYELFPSWLKEANEKYKTKAKVIFFVDPPGQKKDQFLNIFKINDLGKNYYFMMKSDNVIYEADSMLCSGDIVENSIRKKHKELEDKKKKKEDLEKERIKAISNFYDFIINIDKFRYNFYIGYQCLVCFKLNEENQLYLSYVHFSHLIAELRTKEYKIIKNVADNFIPDIEDVQEIKIIDIPISFNENQCKVCKREILQEEPMYYCYICKEKYCQKCVIDNFNNEKNSKKAKFIDQKHNLIYFKTRNLESFKNIDEPKLGKNSFAQCKDDSKLGPHSYVCNGCTAEDVKNQPRFLCLNCRPGMLQDNGYNDFCIHCIEEMNKGTEKGRKIQETEDNIFNQEIRFFENKTEKMRHDHENHIYLMLPLEYKAEGENGYYDF